MATLKIKSDLIYYCSGCLKTHESAFCFSGLPKFDIQGCHISGGYRDTISRLMSNDGQNTNLNYPAFRFFGGIRLESCLLWNPQCSINKSKFRVISSDFPFSCAPCRPQGETRTRRFFPSGAIHIWCPNIFGIFKPLPPCHGPTHATYQYYRHVLTNPPPSPSVRTSFKYRPLGKYPQNYPPRFFFS